MLVQPSCKCHLTLWQQYTQYLLATASRGVHLHLAHGGRIFATIFVKIFATMRKKMMNAPFAKSCSRPLESLPKITLNTPWNCWQMVLGNLVIHLQEIGFLHELQSLQICQWSRVTLKRNYIKALELRAYMAPETLHRSNSKLSEVIIFFLQFRWP